MRLKRVRIFGFKTFADRTEFSLDGGVIAVVGPNGCGKSNLVDAILWGLGEGNARQLRAQSSQDVIFSGSSTRKSVGFAEVDLLFDNEDGGLPLGTSEVTISRKLNRSGDSDYQINRQSCRLRDIYDLLADSGLGRAGYAIVGQKEIDAALSASADERRGWIDEAAGVQRYRSRKIEANRRLATANEHLTRVRDIVLELESQREPLRLEAETARRYKNLLESLKEVEIGLLIQDVNSATRELVDLELRIETSIKVAAEEGKRAEELDAKVRETGAQISELELEMDSVRSSLQQCLTALERAESDIRLAEQRLQNLDEIEKTSTADSEEADTRVAEAEQELTKLAEEEKAELEALSQLKEGYAGVGEEARQLKDALRIAERTLEEGRRLHSLFLRQSAEDAHKKDRLKILVRELQGIDDSRPDIEEAVTEADKTLKEIEARFAGVHQQIQEAEQEAQRLRKEGEADSARVRQALAERAALEGRRRGIEATIEAHDGLTQGSKAVLEAADRGLLQAEYVPVAQVIESEKDLALAIETALGASANDLIVDSDQDAKRAIQWLKENRAGRATFQPIPLMRPVEPSFELRRLLNESGVVGRGSELAQCKAKYRPVIDSLLGRILVVEELDDALRLARTTGWSRMVTLDGEVVHASGAVTGGTQRNTGYGLVQRNADLAEIAEQLRQLDKVIKEQESRTEKRDRLIAQALTRAEEARASIGTNEEMDEARSYLFALQEELKGMNREREKLEREKLSLTGGTGEVGQEVDIKALELARDEAMTALASRSADAEQATERLREAEARASQATNRKVTAERRLGSAKEILTLRLKRSEGFGPEREKANDDKVRATEAAKLAGESRDELSKKLEGLGTVRREMLEHSLALADEAKQARNNATSVSDAAHQAELSRTRIETKKATAVQRLYEEYALTEEEALGMEGQHEVPDDAATVVNRLRRDIRSMGDVNLGAIEAYDRLNQRYEELFAQEDDIRSGISQIEASIRELDKLTREKFLNTFYAVQSEFTVMYEKMFGGGEGKLSLSDPEHVLDSGVEIEVVLPGKKRQPLNLLSGGERSLCASAFLFSLLKVKPSPLVVLDEVDAPLDGRNVERFAGALRDFTGTTQFIVITHNHATIVKADVWVGVTMQEGVSLLAPVKLPDATKLSEQPPITDLSE